MSRRKRKKESSSGGGGGWITTFSDLMSLLLTFFILLFSMSTVSDEKFSQASQSINTAFANGSGILPEETSITSSDNKAAEEASEKKIPQELIEMYNTVVGYLKDKEMDATVTVEVDSEGLYMNIQESILFASGKADISATGEQTLDDLAGVIKKFDNQIIVEGYTDNVPNVHSKYETNWELSTARAVSVLRYLTEQQQIKPTRLSARGYGEYSPIAPNDTVQNKAKNRRVNIVMLYDSDEQQEEQKK